MPKNLYAGIFKWFWAVLPGQNNFVRKILKIKYGYQIACFKKIVESGHMPELRKLKTYSWKLKKVLC